MNAIHEKNLIQEITKKYSLENSLVISNNKKVKTLTNIKIFSVNEFCEYLIKKSPLLFPPYILSQTECILLIHSLIKESFKENRALFNLTKSINFSGEIYKLFKKFYNSNISPQNFGDLIKKFFFDEEDFDRLKIISKTFDAYTKTLKEQNYIDNANICTEITNLLQKFPMHLEITRQNCQNILIDNSLEITATLDKLLKTINTNIELIPINEKWQNIATKALSKKYLKANMSEKEKDCDIKLFNFNDITDEATYIAKTIMEKTINKENSFEDFTIALNDENSCKIFNDIFLQNNIPTNQILTDEDYSLFLIKLNQYLNICENKQKLISSSNLPKSQIESIHEEINLNFENIISETLENQFVKDKFLSSFANNQELCLINYVKTNLNFLTVNDSQKIEKEIIKIENLSDLYNKKSLSLFIGKASQNITLSPLAKENIAKLIKKTSSAERLLYKTDFNPLILRELLFSNKNEFFESAAGCVNLTTLNNAENSYSKIIFLPNFTENNLPIQKNQIQFISQQANDKLYNALKIHDKNFENIIATNEEQIITSAKKLINIISQGQEEIIFSTHKYENKKQVIPSLFFQFLNTILPINNPENIKKSTIDYQKEKDITPEQKQEIVIKQEEILKLSPSSISSFQTCPRKFYYANLLGIKTPSSFCASYGTIAHAIFELFNKKHLKSYNKESILNLCNILFESITNSQNAITAGFDQRTIDLVCATDILSLEEMKTQFEQAITELETKGFFNKIPDEIICEKSFEFSHPLLPNTILNGRIDAIYKFKDKYQLIDFKTGADKEDLSYLISENGVNFKTKTGKDTNIEIKQNQYEYQIPIYHFACKYSKDFTNIKENIESLGLLYIRPKNKHNGIKEDIIDSHTIEEFETKIIENLKETIVEKIRNKTYFEPKPNEISCSNCSFKNLCELNSEENDD